MTTLETIQKGIEYLPKGIALVRDLITKTIVALNLPGNTYMAVVGILSIIIAYYFLKQFIVTNLFWKVRTIINMLFIALLLYLLITYV